MKRKKRVAVYQGSFDPITNGHLYIIKKGVELFDELIIGVGINADKKSTFSLEERTELIKVCTKDIGEIKVLPYPKEFMVDFAIRNGADFIFRGLRDETDYQYERKMCNANMKFEKSITTIWINTSPEVAEASSSFVKGMVGLDNWEGRVAKFVPKAVLRKLGEEYGKRTGS